MEPGESIQKSAPKREFPERNNRYGADFKLQIVKRLRMVDEAEDFLFGLGFKQVRVRHYVNLARIEVLNEEIIRLTDCSLREKVVSHLKKIGYRYVTLDLQGFRSGSMNEVLG